MSHASSSSVTALGASWISLAYTQQIPTFVVGLALTPVVVVLLSIFLGIVTQSWKLGLGSVLLTGFWVLWFVLAAWFFDRDIVIWAPLYGLGVHLVLLVVFLAWRVVSGVVRPRGGG